MHNLKSAVFSRQSRITRKLLQVGEMFSINFGERIAPSPPERECESSSFPNQESGETDLRLDAS